MPSFENRGGPAREKREARCSLAGLPPGEGRGGTGQLENPEQRGGGHVCTSRGTRRGRWGCPFGRSIFWLIRGTGGPLDGRAVARPRNRPGRLACPNPPARPDRRAPCAGITLDLLCRFPARPRPGHAGGELDAHFRPRREASRPVVRGTRERDRYPNGPRRGVLTDHAAAHGAGSNETAPGAIGRQEGQGVLARGAGRCAGRSLGRGPGKPGFASNSGSWQKFRFVSRTLLALLQHSVRVVLASPCSKPHASG